MDDLNREALEMRRIAGCQTHIFLWVSAGVLKNDHDLRMLNSGLYEGLKLHEDEAHWVRDRPRELLRILSVANERILPVQFHAGCFGESRPAVLAKYAWKFQNVRFDFAHCPNMKEMEKVMADCPNVWTDTACWPPEHFEKARAYDWQGRLMFGTDVPVWQAYEEVGLTKRYREYVASFRHAGFEDMAIRAFRTFVGKVG